jgi:flagella basal body P-ring formation protein FlgA
MINYKNLFLGLMLTGTLIGTAQAERLELKNNIIVSSDVVTLGDLFENAGAAAGIAVFRAPDLGMSGTIQASRVEEATYRHNLEWYAGSFASEINVTRAARSISREQVSEVLASYLAEKENAHSFEVILPASFDGFVVEDTATAPLQVVSAEMLYGNRVRATLAVPGSQVASNGLSLDAVAYEMAEIIISQTSIPRGQIISANDVQVSIMRKDRAGFDPATSPSAVIGKAARKSLVAGRTIRYTDLAEPVLVERGKRILIVFVRPGITLSVTGEAMMDGAEGDVVKVMNPQSKRMLEGVVSRDGRVVINSQITLAQAPLYGQNLLNSQTVSNGRNLSNGETR